MLRGFHYLVVTGLIYGFIAVGGRFFLNLGLSLYEAGTFAWLFTPIILLPAVLVRKQYRPKLPDLKFFAAYGFAGAMLSFNQWAGLLFGVPVAVVVFLLYLQPVWTLIIGRIWLKEMFTARKLVAVALALIGILLLVSPFGLSSPGASIGLVFPIFAGVFLSVNYVLGRIGGLRRIHPVTMNFGFRGFHIIWAIALLPVFSRMIDDPAFTRLRIDLGLQSWIFLFIFSLTIGVASGLLLYKGLQTVPASVAGVILLLEPLSATALASILFNEPITYNILGGGALILSADYLLLRVKPQAS